MKEQIQAIVTVLSLVNPAICGAMFAQIEENRSRSQQVADATKAVLATMVILAISALLGTQLLHLFGVSLDAFMVAGGGVLAWMGFSMLRGQAAPPTSGNAPPHSSVSLTPLVLFAASPGTVTGVITFSAAHTGLDLPVTALVAIHGRRSRQEKGWWRRHAWLATTAAAFSIGAVVISGAVGRAQRATVLCDPARDFSRSP